MTKILFSNPPWWEESGGELRQGIRAGSRWPFTRHAHHEPDKFRFGGYLPYPFFLGAAAAYTKREFDPKRGQTMGTHEINASVTIRDSIARGESYQEFIEHVVDAYYDFIVIETATPSWTHDAELLRCLIEQTPGSRVILTGTLDIKKASEIFAAHPNVAAIAQGEYDAQIPAIISELKSNPAPKPRVWPHRLLTVAEMNDAPFPLYDPKAEGHYLDACPVHRGNVSLWPHLQIWTSRGCPFRCIFCVWPATMTGNDPDGTGPRKVRSHTPEWVEAMIRDRLKQAAAAGVNYRSIYLDDDTFNLTEKHTRAICGVMKRIGLPWSAMCRADTISRDTWRLMAESGCYGVKLGFESGSQYVIDHIVNKRLDITKAAETARFLRELGMSVHGTFTIGLPGETPEQQQETRDFIGALYATGAIDTHQLSGTAEVEGTPLHTLRTSGPLAKYDGATMGPGYVVSQDGQRKAEAMN